MPIFEPSPPARTAIMPIDFKVACHRAIAWQPLPAVA